MFIWIIVAMILFALAVTATPSDNMDSVDVFWLAILAVTWPLIVCISVFGIAITLLAAMLRPR